MLGELTPITNHHLFPQIFPKAGQEAILTFQKETFSIGNKLISDFVGTNRDKFSLGPRTDTGPDIRLDTIYSFWYRTSFVNANFPVSRTGGNLNIL